MTLPVYMNPASLPRPFRVYIRQHSDDTGSLAIAITLVLGTGQNEKKELAELLVSCRLSSHCTAGRDTMEVLLFSLVEH